MENEKDIKVNFNSKTAASLKRGTLASSDMKDDIANFFTEGRGRTGTTVGGMGSSNEPQGAAALENILDLESTTQEDIIANVEIML